MVEFALLGAMNDKSSPFEGGLIQHLCLNGEVRRPGYFEKRRGFATAVTLGATFGTAPYDLFRWTNASGSALVAVGADALAFVNPSNGYLYTRTSGASEIYSDPTNFATKVDTEWGLAEPSAVTTTSSTAASRLAGGYYAYAISNYDATRNLDGPVSPVLAAHDGDLLEGVSGPGQKVAFGDATLDAKASHLRVWRNRILTFPKASTGWYPLQADNLQFSGLRMIAEETKNTSGAGSTHSVGDDTGGQPYGPLLAFATTVAPRCKAVIRFDGRWFYGNDAANSKPYRVVWSNPDCPETYAATTTFGTGGPTVTPALGELGPNGIVQGEAVIDLPPDMGEIVGFASAGDQLLVLCQYGAWRIIRVGDFSYGYARDPLSLGCVSKATIADSPYGTWWLAREGVVLWDGQTVPELVLRNQLDPSASDATFHATLTGACAAYHVRRGQYIVCVPQVTSGQFLLCVQADQPFRNGYPFQKWTHGLPTAIDGMGYDHTTGEVVYHLATSGDCWSAKDATYQDGTASPASYAFGFDAWWARGGERGLVLANQDVYLTCYRSSVTNAQTITLNVRAAPTVDTSAGSETGDVTLTLGANARPIVGNICGVSGEAWHFSVRNTDAYHLALLAMSVGEPQRRGA